MEALIHITGQKLNFLTLEKTDSEEHSSLRHIFGKAKKETGLDFLCFEGTRDSPISP